MAPNFLLGARNRRHIARPGREGVVLPPKEEGHFSVQSSTCATRPPTTQRQEAIEKELQINGTTYLANDAVDARAPRRQGLLHTAAKSGRLRWSPPKQEEQERTDKNGEKLTGQLTDRWSGKNT